MICNEYRDMSCRVVQFCQLHWLKLALIKTAKLFLVKNAFIYITGTIISPNLLTQVQTLAAMGVVLIDKFM